MSGHRRTLKRYEHRNDVRYLTCSCYRQFPLFQNDLIKDLFVEHLRMTLEDYDVHLYAWVLMPEHFHLLVRPSHIEQSLTPIVRRLKAGLAKRVIQRWRELGAAIIERITDTNGAVRFWQRGGGYDRNIFSESELLEKIRYIHLNPVRRGLVEKPIDWKWSSARRYESQENAIGPAITDAF